MIIFETVFQESGICGVGKSVLDDFRDEEGVQKVIPIE